MTGARKKTLWLRAHEYASRAKLKAPEEWPKESLGIYWWGLFTGFQAGIRAAKRDKR